MVLWNWISKTIDCMITSKDLSIAVAKTSASSLLEKLRPYTCLLSRHWWNVGVAWLYLRPFKMAQFMTTWNAIIKWLQDLIRIWIIFEYVKHKYLRLYHYGLPHDLEVSFQQLGKYCWENDGKCEPLTIHEMILREPIFCWDHRIS